MRVVVADPLAYAEPFASELRAALPGLDLRMWPDLAANADYDILVAWTLPPDLVSLPDSLKAVLCFGAGIDQLLADPRLPDHLPIARLHDPAQADQLLDYAMHAAFARLQDDVGVRTNQAARAWIAPPAPNRSREGLAVAVLGLGSLGAHVASGLASAGFAVSAWSRSARSLDGVRCWHGADDLLACVDAADLLISLLPAAPELRGILSAPLFDRLAPGAYVANLGRGEHLDEAALRQALDRGRLGGAWLDVFAVEPLPDTHWFWTHPRVRLTPHRAGLPTPRGTAQAIAGVVGALRAGLPLR